VWYDLSMNNQMHRDDGPSRPTASQDDNVRDAVTWQDATTYSLGLPEVYGRFVEAGLDRSLRTLQRYCEQGHLRAAKYPTDTGSVWRVDPHSVDIKIEEIRQVQETLYRPAPSLDDTPRPTSHDASRHDAESRQTSSQKIESDDRDTPAAQNDDKPSQQNADVTRRANHEDAKPPSAGERQSTPSDDEKYVTVPVGVLDALTGQLAAKDEQIKRRDEQMERLVDAHDKDRRLLSTALAIIHRDDFPFGLDEPKETAPEPVLQPAEEIRPEFSERGGNPQQSTHDLGV
jgi:hypothetical protein